MAIIIPEVNFYTYIITTEDTERTERTCSHFLYSVFSCFPWLNFHLRLVKEFGSLIIITKVYFASIFFQKFREEPPAKRAVRAPGIDTKKQIPRFGSVLNPSQKTGPFKAI